MYIQIQINRPIRQRVMYALGVTFDVKIAPDVRTYVRRILDLLYVDAADDV